MSRMSYTSFSISLCVLLIIGCGSDAANAPAVQQPSSLDDLEKIIASERPDGGTAIRDQAMALIEKGKTLEAEKLLLDHVRDVGSKFGEESRNFAWAQFDLATVYISMDQMPRAIDAMRKACAVKLPDDRQATKDRLTFLMNLGEFLTFDGQLGEAQQVLRENLKEREAFYGRGHPGFAYGLEPLASVLARVGQYDEALTLIDEALANYRQNEHPNVVVSMARRGAIRAESKKEGPLFEGHEQLTDQLILDLAHSIPSFVSLEHPHAGKAICVELHPIVAGRFGDRHQDALQLLAIQSNMERAMGDHAAREQTLQKLLAMYDELGQPEQSINLLKAIAMAQEEDVRPEDAEKTYKAALERAEKLGQPEFESDVLRNYGLFLAERERIDDARTRLEAALAKAPPAGSEVRGVAQIALGIFCQHRGDLPRARSLLADGITVLDPLSTDALCGRSHLNAIETGADCGCSQATMTAAISTAMRQYIQERLPKGLSAEIVVHPPQSPEQDWTVKVESKVDSTTQQQVEINRIIEHALAHFRKQVAQGAYSPAYSQLRK